MASNGEYQKDGETKKRWQRVGTLFKDDQDGRISIKLDSIPVGPEWSGWLAAFTMDDNQTGQAQNVQSQPTTTRNVYDQQNQPSDNPAAAAHVEGEDIPF